MSQTSLLFEQVSVSHQNVSAGIWMSVLSSVKPIPRHSDFSALLQEQKQSGASLMACRGRGRLYGRHYDRQQHAVDTVMVTGWSAAGCSSCFSSLASSQNGNRVLYLPCSTFYPGIWNSLLAKSVQEWSTRDPWTHTLLKHQMNKYWVSVIKSIEKSTWCVQMTCRILLQRNIRK